MNGKAVPGSLRTRTNRIGLRMPGFWFESQMRQDDTQICAFELGNYQDCLLWFLHASLNSPHTAHVLSDKSKLKPKTLSEVEDHNSGIMLARSLPRFFQLRSKASRKFFNKFMDNLEVKQLLAEVVRCDRTHSDRQANSDRTYFDRWLELKRLDFARKTATSLMDELVAAKALPSYIGAKKSLVRKRFRRLDLAACLY